MNIAIAQSGGPTVAINASLAGVYQEAVKHSTIGEIYGCKNGIEGILSDNFVNLRERFSTNEEIELLKLTPSTALGSCRLKLPNYEDDPQIYDKIISIFEEHDIGAFFYIGGNDSMDTVAKLSKHIANIGKNIKIIGIPKTIDNDLRETDHTPGFGSAAKYLTTTVKEIMCDSQVYALKSVTIIEVMGRDAGWLTASTALLRANGDIAPHLIYLPEIAFDEDKFIEDIQAIQQEHKAVIVAVSEGLRDAYGEYVGSGNMSGAVDNFGHKYLSGLGKYLEVVVKEKIGCKVRSIELNVMQRCSSHLASKTDLDEACMIGQAAVEWALKGLTGKMMAFKRLSNNPYSVKVEPVDVDLVANLEKRFPAEWISEKGNQVKDEAIEYLLPLIQGEVITNYKNGMPVHFVI